MLSVVPVGRRSAFLQPRINRSRIYSSRWALADETSQGAIAAESDLPSDHVPNLPLRPSRQRSPFVLCLALHRRTVAILDHIKALERLFSLEGATGDEAPLDLVLLPPPVQQDADPPVAQRFANLRQ